MLNRYIRGCENSTLANVLTPFCTALGVQTPLYREALLYSNEGECCTALHSDTCVFFDAMLEVRSKYGNIVATQVCWNATAFTIATCQIGCLFL